MTTVIVMAAFAVLCAVQALILHRHFPRGRSAVPFWTTTGLVGLLLGIVVGVEFVDAFAKKRTSQQIAPYVEPVTVRVRHPLMQGDKINAFQSGGWLNGTPPKLTHGNEQVYVLDVLANWCPVCREAAPVIVQSYDKFKDQGVQFVSLSVMPEEAMQSFVNDNQVTWPVGFDATIETILAYGALDPYTSPMASPMVATSVEDGAVVPTLYVLRGDGTVLWTDENSRHNHEPLDVIGSKLDAAIEAALAGRGEARQD